MGIGLVLEPQAAVIGGPPAVIRSRTKAFAELKPGQYEPNDVAKKVLRLLRQNISPDEEKLLKGILNTDTVAAFVPPGVGYFGDAMKAEYGELKDNSGEIRLLRRHR